MKSGFQEENISTLREYLPYILEKKQYFDEDIIRFSEHEVFVDGGSMNLGTTEVFMEEARRRGCTVKKVWAFEPDADNYQNCRNILLSKGMKNVELVNVGLWSKDTYMGFRGNGGGGSRITETEETGSRRIKVVALDSVIHEEVTFIKMDIEGAEMEALQGARKLILQYKPKLAICIYHKKDDMWEIPYYIKQLVPEYKLYIRHYSNCGWETVCYAV